MKFGKGLKRQIEETLPQWRDQFLSYKELKKLLRQISATPASSEVEAEFVCLLDGELDKLNSFFGEQEEEFVIRQRELQERIQDIIVREAEFDDAEMGRIRKDIVDLHGEMVLLLNYSSINYTGLAKILKKYDKRTGALLRLPFIDKVLKQPFFETNLISALVKQCESTMDVVFPIPPGVEERGGRRESTTPEQSVLRSTIAALVTMRELRNGSSTYGRFSLPPMNLAKIDILESLQVASPIPIP